MFNCSIVQCSIVANVQLFNCWKFNWQEIYSAVVWPIMFITRQSLLRCSVAPCVIITISCHSRCPGSNKQTKKETNKHPLRIVHLKIVFDLNLMIWIVMRQGVGQNFVNKLPTIIFLRIVQFSQKIDRVGVPKNGGNIINFP